MKKIIPFISAQMVMLTPFLALAQGSQGGSFGRLGKLFTDAGSFINTTLIPLMFALALLVFFYGIFKFFILGGGDSEKRAEGRQLMLWAIIGFVVMVSIYGIITLISSSLGINNTTPPPLPTVNIR